MTFIGAHVLRPGEGNVYTGAKPPWEMDDEEEEKRRATTTHAPPAPPAAATALLRPQQLHEATAAVREAAPPIGETKRRRGTEAEASDAWLPNFGGTFHIGSRREFKNSFRQEVRRPFHNA